jgi:hypothetical protein
MLALNVFDPSLSYIAEHLGPLGTALCKHAEFHHQPSQRRVVVWSTRKYDPAAQILTEERIYEELDQEGRVVQRTYAPFSVRWFYRYEMEHLFSLAGFTVEALYGDFRQGQFRHGGEQVWIVRPQG